MVRSIKNLIAAILISLSFYFSLSVLLPKYESFASLKATIDARAATLESRNKIVKKIQDLKERYVEGYAELQRLALVVPKNKSLPEFISTLEAISLKTGIALGGLKLGGGSGGLEQSFNILNFETGVEGSYESLLGYLSYLEKNIRLIDVNSISISRSEEVEDEGTGNLLLQLRGQAYYLRSEEEITTPVKLAPAPKKTE